MAKKKSFVLRIDEEMYSAVEKWAADEFRSVNGQIEWILASKLKESGRYKHLERGGAAPPQPETPGPKNT